MLENPIFFRKSVNPECLEMPGFMGQKMESVNHAESPMNSGLRIKV